MPTFFLKSCLFLVSNLLIAVALLNFFSGRHSDLRIPVARTESNIFSIQPGVHYDVVLLGTSRGRVFSRDGNQRVVEEVLGKRVANLSKGGGGGLMPAEVHLRHFFVNGGRAGQVVYLMDPWVFFAPINNEENAFFLRDEPFELDIFLHLLGEGYPLKRLSAYLQMIPDRDWHKVSRYGEPGMAFRTLRQIDKDKQEKAREYYRKSYRGGDFDRYFSYLGKIHDLAAEHGGSLTLIMLPILMDDFPGAEQVDNALREFVHGRKDVSYFNLIGSMQDRRFFYDHMHFNRAGIEAFTRSVLRPALEGKAPVPVGSLESR